MYDLQTLSTSPYRKLVLKYVFLCAPFWFAIVRFNLDLNHLQEPFLEFSLFFLSQILVNGLHMLQYISLKFVLLIFTVDYSIYLH